MPFSSKKLGIWIVKGKLTGFGVRKPGFESQFCHSLARLSENVSQKYTSLNFLIGKMGLIKHNICFVFAALQSPSTLLP